MFHIWAFLIFWGQEKNDQLFLGGGALASSLRLCFCFLHAIFHYNFHRIPIESGPDFLTRTLTFTRLAIGVALPKGATHRYFHDDSERNICIPSPEMYSQHFFLFVFWFFLLPPDQSRRGMAGSGCFLCCCFFGRAGLMIIHEPDSRLEAIMLSLLSGINSLTRIRLKLSQQAKMADAKGICLFSAADST